MNQKACDTSAELESLEAALSERNVPKALEHAKSRIAGGGLDALQAHLRQFAAEDLCNSLILACRGGLVDARMLSGNVYSN